MEIHKPRPSHNWKEFLSEIGVIVIGILIALSAEQVIEYVHWSAEVRSARDAMHEEMNWANTVFAFRAQAEQCVDRRLDELQSLVERAAAHQLTQSVGPVSLDISNSIQDSAWQAHRASQTLTHFPQRELILLGEYYQQVQTVRDMLLGEVPQWSELKVIQGDPARLGPQDVAGLRSAVEHARDSNRLIALISREQVERSRRLNWPPAAAPQDRLDAVCSAKSLTIAEPK